MLTERKRKALHTDILEYLRAMGFNDTATLFEDEMNGEVSESADVCTLERKYANFLRTARQLSQAEVWPPLCDNKIVYFFWGDFYLMLCDNE